MGLADLIPGISGGTIAFITNIYERLMNAIKRFSFENMLETKKIILSNKSNKFLKISKVFDLKFLFFLFLGIISAIIIGSRGINYLLNNHFVSLLSFFVGLIFASSLIIYKHISVHTLRNFILGVLGFILGMSFIFFSPLQVVSPSLFYIFIGGFVAITALFLPGISGSFILLLLGLYEFMIDKLQSPLNSLKELGVFLFGGVIGAVIISRIITYLFEKDKAKTLYFLLGLVIGSLSVPLLRIFNSVQTFSFETITSISLMILLGIAVVLAIERLS